MWLIAGHRQHARSIGVELINHLFLRSVKLLEMLASGYKKDTFQAVRNKCFGE